MVWYDFLGFKVVFELRNLTHAALALNLSQPAVTKLVKRLEDHFAVSLFERHKTGLMPNQYAERLYEAILEMERTYLAAKSDIGKRSEDELPDNLKIGCNTIWNYLYLPPLLGTEGLFRNKSFSIEVDSSPALLEGLLAGSYDLVFCKFIPEAIRANMVFKPVLKTRLAVFSKDDAIHEGKMISLAHDNAASSMKGRHAGVEPLYELLARPKATVQTLFSMINLMRDGGYCTILPVDFETVFADYGIHENIEYSEYFPSYWCGVAYMEPFQDPSVIEAIRHTLLDSNGTAAP